MDQTTSMNMLNSAIYIIVDVRGIKLKLGVYKVLDHVCNKTCLEKKQILESSKSEMTISYWYWKLTSLKQKKSINPTKTLACSRPICRVPYIFSSSFLLNCTKQRDQILIIPFKKGKEQSIPYDDQSNNHRAQSNQRSPVSWDTLSVYRSRVLGWGK